MARSRPAQGNNSNKPFGRPRPAYKPSVAPTVFAAGTQSKPKPNPWARALKRDAQDATPKIVKL